MPDLTNPRTYRPKGPNHTKSHPDVASTARPCRARPYRTRTTPYRPFGPNLTASSPAHSLPQRSIASTNRTASHQSSPNHAPQFASPQVCAPFLRRSVCREPMPKHGPPDRIGPNLAVPSPNPILTNHTAEDQNLPHQDSARLAAINPPKVCSLRQRTFQNLVGNRPDRLVFQLEQSCRAAFVNRRILVDLPSERIWLSSLDSWRAVAA